MPFILNIFHRKRTKQKIHDNGKFTTDYDCQNDYCHPHCGGNGNREIFFDTISLGSAYWDGQLSVFKYAGAKNISFAQFYKRHFFGRHTASPGINRIFFLYRIESYFQ